MAIYSHSRLSTFEQCALKYKYKYLDKLPPDFEESIEGFLGKKVHEVLQWIYDNNKNDLDEVIKYFIELWNKDFNENIKIVKDLSVDYYFNKGIRFIANYYTKNYPFKDNTIATEKKVYVSLDNNSKYKLLGYIDRLVLHKETNIFEIHDYKTGSLKNQKELDKDRQLALYSIAIRESFENVNDIHLLWHFLDYNELRVSKRTIGQLDTLRRDIIELIKKIENSVYFQPNPGALCNWCEFQSYCPAFKKLTIKKDIEPDNGFFEK